MKKEYDFSAGVRGKYLGKIKKDFWILEPDLCRFCGKLSYDSLEDAEYAAKNNSRVYVCPYESVWHLTSKI
jgi:hypothetical protein